MKLVTYNIQYGFGADGHYDLARIAASLPGADIICLQEVERFWHRSQKQDQVAELARLLPEYYYVYGANLDMDASVRQQNGHIQHRRRQFGNMILSRTPILSSRNFPLPKQASLHQHSIQQGLLEAVIAPAGKALRIYTTHLSHLCPDTRLPQLQAIQEIIAAAPSQGGAWCGSHPNPADGWIEGDMPPMPQAAILTGDLNFDADSREYASLIGPKSEKYGRLINPTGWQDAYVCAGHEEATGTTCQSGKRIDHCFVTGDLASKIVAVDIDGAAKGSDHQPVWVSFAED